jgi:hypothetical protein
LELSAPELSVSALEPSLDDNRERQQTAKETLAEQAGTSNGGQRLPLNSGFHSRRGWPIRSPK